MKKIVLAMFCGLLCITSITKATAKSPVGIFIKTKDIPLCILIKADGSFIYKYAPSSAIRNSGTWTLESNNNLILKFTKQTGLMDQINAGYLNGLELRCKIINKNTIECENQKLKRYPKHPTKRMKEIFEAFEPTIRYYQNKNN